MLPAALFAMLIPIATAAAGAGVLLRNGPGMRGSLALTALLINIWAYGVEYRTIRTNAGVLDDVLTEVDRIRARARRPATRRPSSRKGRDLPIAALALL